MKSTIKKTVEQKCTKVTHCVEEPFISKMISAKNEGRISFSPWKAFKLSQAQSRNLTIHVFGTQLVCMRLIKQKES